MKTRLSKVYENMPRKINLSIAADLDDAYEKYKDIIGTHEAALNELVESKIKLKEAQSDVEYYNDIEEELFQDLIVDRDNVSIILGELETKVGELGFAPSDLFPDYQELVYALDKVDDIINKRNNI